jgi:4'-phosphopantetheinyl transferase
VGIDVARLARRVRAGPVLARMSAPAERAAAEAEAEHRGAPAVLERWVAKEAVVKALGRGLSLPLAQVVLERDAEGRLELVELCGSAACAAAWELRAVAVEDGFVAAAALAR